MDTIKVTNIFAAVSDKSVLDPLLEVLDKRSVKFWGTEGTVRYLKSKGFWARSVVSGFDFDGRVKTLDRSVFARILADRSKKQHLEKLKGLIYGVIARSPSILLRATKQSVDRHAKSDLARDDRGWEPFDLVIVDLYAPNKKNFPESMDIGGQALIRAAIKNYKNVALTFDRRSLASLVGEMLRNSGSTSLAFRKKQAKSALKFITARCKIESSYL